jgi:hypothetical protein
VGDGLGEGLGEWLFECDGLGDGLDDCDGLGEVEGDGLLEVEPSVGLGLFVPPGSDVLGLGLGVSVGLTVSDGLGLCEGLVSRKTSRVAVVTSAVAAEPHGELDCRAGAASAGAIVNPASRKPAPQVAATARPARKTPLGTPHSIDRADLRPVPASRRCGYYPLSWWGIPTVTIASPAITGISGFADVVKCASWNPTAHNDRVGDDADSIFEMAVR